MNKTEKLILEILGISDVTKDELIKMAADMDVDDLREFVQIWRYIVSYNFHLDPNFKKDVKLRPKMEKLAAKLNMTLDEFCRYAANGLSEADVAKFESLLEQKH